LETNKKKLFSTFFKIAISVFLLYLVFTKISFTEVWSSIKTVNLFYLFLAVLFFIISQWVSARRLLLFLKEKNFNLSKKSNNILYVIGMFYNFFIPGGIGGDAYKVFALNKKFKWPVKSLSGIIFIDRFMGLTAIGILVIILGYDIFVKLNLLWLSPILLISGVLFSVLFVNKVFPSFKNIYFKTLLISILIQILQVISVVFIILSIGHQPLNLISYVVIFLISSVLSIFSFSGIGVREYVFFEASKLLGTDSSTAVSIGVLFSIITAGVSLFGIVYHFKDSEKYLEEE